MSEKAPSSYSTPLETDDSNQPESTPIGVEDHGEAPIDVPVHEGTVRRPVRTRETGWKLKFLDNAPDDATMVIRRPVRRRETGWRPEPLDAPIESRSKTGAVLRRTADVLDARAQRRYEEKIAESAPDVEPHAATAGYNLEGDEADAIFESFKARRAIKDERWKNKQEVEPRGPTYRQKIGHAVVETAKATKERVMPTEPIAEEENYAYWYKFSADSSDEPYQTMAERRAEKDKRWKDELPPEATSRDAKRAENARERAPEKTRRRKIGRAGFLAALLSGFESFKETRNILKEEESTFPTENKARPKSA